VAVRTTRVERTWYRRLETGMFHERREKVAVERAKTAKATQRVMCPT